MDDKIQSYTDKQLLELTAVLNDVLRMPQEHAHGYAEHILETGEYAFIGYGSLIGDPTAPHDQQFRGRVPEMAVNAACAEVYYRGTPEKPHRTASAIPAEGQSIRGLVQITRFRKADEETTDAHLANIRKYLGSFIAREDGPTPRITRTYKYLAPEVIPDVPREKKVRGIMAIADEGRPNFWARLPAILMLSLSRVYPSTKAKAQAGLISPRSKPWHPGLITSQPGKMARSKVTKLAGRALVITVSSYPTG